MYRLAACFGLAFLVVGCTTGRDFAKPAADTIAPGTTTRAEILGKFGEPYRQSSLVRSDATGAAQPASPVALAPIGGTFASLTYVYADRSATLLYGGPPTAKSVTFIFWNDTLVGYNYISNFDADSSNFDESRIGALEKGKSLKPDVVALLGQPTGRRIYPLIRDNGNEVFIYEYVALTRGERRTKTLGIIFTSDGAVADYAFGSDAAPLPQAPATNYVPAPIVVPHKK